LEVKNKDSNTTNTINAVADHSRAVIFAISDGVAPSNEERGYVIRKLIRKALWGGYSLGYKDTFIYKLVDKYVEIMGGHYPQILKEKQRISDIIRIEEEKFLSTIEGARSQFYIVLGKLKESKKHIIDGKSAFKLYDTYGFPLELTKNLASENGLDVDEDGFYDMLKLQKESSRKQSMFADTIFSKDDYAVSKKTEFSGYTVFNKETVISAILKNKIEVFCLESGEKGVIILDNTPFYPESGGQLADRGLIKTEKGEFIVENVQKSNEAILHIGQVSKGKITLTNCAVSVDARRRHALMRAHTATHLLQAALRGILGEHIAQQGSFVDEDRLRFDFSHFKALNSKELRLVEERVNYFILRSDKVIKKEISFGEAQKEGALAFFKDKYKNRVRVVSISDYSKELCGGTHIDSTSEIGSFIITNEFSVSSGVRRIEALVGNEALKKALFYKDKIKNLTELLKTKEEEIIRAVKNMENTLKSYKNKVDNLEKTLLSTRIDDIIESGTDVKKNKIFIYAFENKDYSHLLYVADALRGKFDHAVIFLSSFNEKRNIFVLAVTKKSAKEFNVENFLVKYRDTLGLKGGGRGLVAQGLLLKEPHKESIEDTLRTYLNKEYE